MCINDVLSIKIHVTASLYVNDIRIVYTRKPNSLNPTDVIIPFELLSVGRWCSKWANVFWLNSLKQLAADVRSVMDACLLTVHQLLSDL